MKNFFGIENDDFFDKNIAKVLDGPAGSAKSSNVHSIFTDAGKPYKRDTSTNKLKRDAERRYGGDVDTIAGGLFLTVNGIFFSKPKPPECENIVIDEILQTDARVLDWVKEWVGKVNIIICTDTHQMLAPVYGDTLLRKFEEFCKQPFVMYTKLEKTYRPRTAETEAYYYEAYKAVDTDENLYRRDRGKFKNISFAEMPYNHNDIYICHTNACERYLFEAFRIADDYEAPLIPKGMIARKSIEDPTRYPIMCQQDVNGKQLCYLQPEHIGTPTRYQGSEVTLEQTLYYLVEPNSRITPREWYTVISRLYDIQNLVIVTCDIPKKIVLTEYNGRPIKDFKAKTLSEDVELSDGRKLSDLCKTDERTVSMPAADFDKIVSTFTDTDTTHFSTSKFFYDGKRILSDATEPADGPINPKAVSMSSLLNKEPDFDFGYMAAFMQNYEKMQKHYFGKVEQDLTTCPAITGSGGLKGKRDYQFGIDMKAAFPSILKNEWLPTGGIFYPRQDGMEQKIAHTDKFDWYIGCVSGQCGLVPWASVKRAMASGYTDFYYIGSSSQKQGSRMGDKLHELAFRSIESDRKRKAIHYGLMNRPWISGIDYEDGKPKAYTIDERSNHQLLKLTIDSYMDCIMYDIKREIYKDFFEFETSGLIKTDCLYFDYDGDIEELGDRIAKKLPGYDFRIFKNSEADKHDNVLYQTYKDLLPEKEVIKIEDRERKRAARAAARRARA